MYFFTRDIKLINFFSNNILHLCVEYQKTRKFSAWTQSIRYKYIQLSMFHAPGSMTEDPWFYSWHRKETFCSLKCQIGYDVKKAWTYTSACPYAFTPGSFSKHINLIILVISEVITAVLAEDSCLLGRDAVSFVRHVETDVSKDRDVYVFKLTAMGDACFLCR